MLMLLFFLFLQYKRKLHLFSLMSLTFLMKNSSSLLAWNQLSHCVALRNANSYNNIICSKSNLTAAGKLPVHLQGFILSPCFSDIEVYFRVCHHTLTALFGVVTGATKHTSDHVT